MEQFGHFIQLWGAGSKMESEESNCLKIITPSSDNCWMSGFSFLLKASFQEFPVGGKELSFNIHSNKHNKMR